jgi:hypothetical protein
MGATGEKMNTEKVYAKKTKYDYGIVWLLGILFIMLHAGMVLSNSTYFRSLIACIDLALCMLITIGIVVQTSEDKEVEIGYIKKEVKKK